MSFENSFSLLSRTGVAPGTPTFSRGSPRQNTFGNALPNSGARHLQAPVRALPKNSPPPAKAQVPEMVPSLRIPVPTSAPHAVRLNRNYKKYPVPMGSRPYMPHAAKGCHCSHPDAIHHVHRCVQKVVFDYKGVPTAPKSMRSPTGQSSRNTRCASLSHKDNLVSYAKAAKAVGPVSRPQGRPVIVNEGWRYNKDRGSPWIHNAKPEEWSYGPPNNAHVQFRPVTKNDWHKGNRQWKNKTNIPNALDSDAYRQHFLGIASDERGRIPLPEEITQIYKKGKVNTPFNVYKTQLKRNTEQKGWRKSTTPTWSRCAPNIASWGYIVSKTRAQSRAAGVFPSNQEGTEVKRVVDEYSNDMGIWQETGRLPGRYKDFPHIKLPKESIFDKPVDDRDNRRARFASNPVTEIRYYIPERTCKKDIP